MKSILTRQNNLPWVLSINDVTFLPPSPVGQAFRYTGTGYVTKSLSPPSNCVTSFIKDPLIKGKISSKEFFNAEIDV